MPAKPKRKIARLKPEEDKAWVFAFNYYLEDGKSETQAGKLAWKSIKEEFPRLRKYDGCK